MEQTFYSYVSTKCDIDCVQTIFICAPEAYAKSSLDLESFVETTGWKDVVENNGAVIIAPIIKNKWKDCSIDRLKETYKKEKNNFKSVSGKSIPGRNGYLWLWETMIYAVGYEEGADYLGNVLVKHSNLFAASALVKGGANDFDSAELFSDHWLVKNPSIDYKVKNNELPSAIWLFDKTKYSNKTYKYFSKINKCMIETIEQNHEITWVKHHNIDEPAQQIRTSYSHTGYERIVPKLIVEQFFNKIIRWKNSPDGTIKLYTGKIDYYKTKYFKHHHVVLNNKKYPYTVYLPKGLNEQDVKGLPLVFSIHGRGEPSWVFAEKNGWDKLADETKAFILVIPDSIDNIWLIERDAEVIESILNDMKEKYSYDVERVYLSGFSNGAIYTCQQASLKPHLFAAASAWNGPSIIECEKLDIASYVFHPEFIHSGYKMPFQLIIGDNDVKAGLLRDKELKVLYEINHCVKEDKIDPSQFYTQDKSYTEGNRFKTKVYTNSNEDKLVEFIIMKDMPHGAIWDESRAAWEFMKKFKRKNKHKEVTIID